MGGKRFMQLELKHYAAYLPYNVECKRSNLEGNIFQLNTETIEFAVNNKDLLILRKITDLNKEIEIDGEKFVPIEKLSPVPNFFNIDFIIKHPLACNYELIEKLLSWHFDVFDLINNGLAVDFNELKKINYELQNTK